MSGRVRMVAEVTGNCDSRWAAVEAVAQELGVGSAETVRKWVRRAEIDTGARSRTSSEESEELKRLRRETPSFKRANESLRTVSAFFASVPR